MEGDIFEHFSFHSAIGIDYALNGDKQFVTKLANTKKVRTMFASSEDGVTLIHKTTRCLWRVSDDGKSILPAFSSDVLTEDDLKEAMEE